MICILDWASSFSCIITHWILQLGIIRIIIMYHSVLVRLRKWIVFFFIFFILLLQVIWLKVVNQLSLIIRVYPLIQQLHLFRLSFRTSNPIVFLWTISTFIWERLIGIIILLDRIFFLNGKFLIIIIFFRIYGFQSILILRGCLIHRLGIWCCHLSFIGWRSGFSLKHYWWLIHDNLLLRMLFHHYQFYFCWGWVLDTDFWRFGFACLLGFILISWRVALGSFYFQFRYSADGCVCLEADSLAGHW